jgi:FAD/FMN-containing dehydrogenase
MPYVALQQMLDPGFPRGIREYFKIDWLASLPDEAVDVVVTEGEELPAPFGELILVPMGGATRRSARKDMALTVPDGPWMYFCLGMWMDPADDQRNIAWTRGFAAAMREFGVGTAFANFVADDEGNRLRMSYGEDKYQRLIALKRRWDPNNLFRLNQNIVLPSS